MTTLHDTETFRQVAAAVLERWRLGIPYWTVSRTEETARTIDPWRLACVDGDWYLIGWCHSRQARRTFAPGRIRNMTETGERFAVPILLDLGVRSPILRIRLQLGRRHSAKLLNPIADLHPQESIKSANAVKGRIAGR